MSLTIEGCTALSLQEFAKKLQQYTKSKAKNKQHLVQALLDHLDMLEKMYEYTQERSIVRSLIAKRITVYSVETLNAFVDCEDFGAVESMIKQSVLSEDEILPVLALHYREHLRHLVSNVPVLAGYVEKHRDELYDLAQKQTIESLQELTRPHNMEDISDDMEALTLRKKRKCL